MEESPKVASSTVKSKDKSSLLDLDMGDDFLKSLKTMSMGKDDEMDFDFGPISKNKKKTFDFDKEDMDFDLDSGFGKMSSFNMDMPDLDIISSPSKKERKSKESKEESTAAVNKKKGDGFNFSFDFELDSFGFGSSQESRDKTKNNKEKDTFSFGSSQESREKAKNSKEKDSFSFESSQESREKGKNDQEKESSSKKSGHEGFGSHLDKDNGSLENRTAKKHTASEVEMSSTANSHIGIDKSHDSRKHSLPSNCTMSDIESSKLQSISIKVALEKEKISLQETISTSTQETDCQVEEGTLISQSESRRNTSGLQEHVESVAADLSFLGVRADVKEKKLLDSNTNYEKSVLESSSFEDVTSMRNAGQRSNFEKNKDVLETTKDRTETHSNSMYVANGTEDKMHEKKVTDKNQNQNSERSASSVSNGVVAENLIPEKRGDADVIRSNFMPLTKPVAQMQKTTSLVETKVSAFLNKRIDPIPQSRSDEMISQDNNNDKTGSKAGFPHQIGSQKNYQVLCNTLSGVNPPSKSQQTTLSTPRSIAVPRNLTITDPCPTAKNTVNEGEKPLPIKAAMRTLDSSSLKKSAKLCTNLEVPRTVLQKNMKSSKAVDQHGGFKAIAQVKDNNFMEKLKQMPANSSTKRKVPETNLDLKILLPSKRLSPNGSRGSSEVTERICHKKVNDHGHSGNGNKTSEYDHCHISSRDVPARMNIEDLGTLAAIDDDDNIKKAQVYSKDLDDICNMLRKKNEEAKELLVRAVVNNNKLLLLNHPIHEEKIRKVQKFAAELIERRQIKSH